MNAYVTELVKEKPVPAVVIRPTSKHAATIAAQKAIAEMFSGKPSSGRLAAMNVAKQYPDSYVSNTQDTPSMLGVGYGDNIVVAPMEDYKEGDDAVYIDADGKSRILHRITHKKPGYYYFKGTFNKNGDGWIPADRIVGKVVYPKPKW